MSRIDLQNEKHVLEAASENLSDGLLGEAAGAYGELLSHYEALVRRLDRDAPAAERRSPEAMMEKLIEIGIALSADHNSDRLMESILREAKDLTNADGGTLYRRTDDDQLRFEIIRNDSLEIAKGGRGRRSSSTRCRCTTRTARRTIKTSRLTSPSASGPSAFPMPTTRRISTSPARSGSTKPWGIARNPS